MVLLIFQQNKYTTVSNEFMNTAGSLVVFQSWTYIIPVFNKQVLESIFKIIDGLDDEMVSGNSNSENNKFIKTNTVRLRFIKSFFSTESALSKKAKLLSFDCII